MIHHRSGQTFLALVFLIGGIITLAGIALAFLATSFINTGYGYQASVNAEAVAQSGIQDALLRLDRDPNFSNTGYILPVGSSTATVSVTQSSRFSGSISILSTATVNNHVKKVDMELDKNSTTGQITIISTTEIQ